jgi:hypothetical protein
MPLPRLKKVVVYIDQFAFSNIMKTLCPDVQGHERAASEPLWKQLFEILSVVCHLQLVACPDSREHHNESLASPFYKLLKRTYESFSGGDSFSDNESVRIRQICRIADCWLKKEPLTFDFRPESISTGRIHNWGDRIYVTGDGVLPGMVDDLRVTRSRSHKTIEKVFAVWQREKRPFKEVLQAEKASFSRGLIRRYREDVRAKQAIPFRIMRGDMPSLDEIMPSQAETTINSLEFTFQHALQKEQVGPEMRDFFNSGAINEALFNVIAASMFASLAMKAASGQRKVPNQGTVNDVNIVSTLLPYCDAMFVDNPCRALLTDIPKAYALRYPCKVFSPNTGAEFIRYLTDIRDSVSAQHLAFVEQVYGPDPLRPPQTIYGVNGGPRDGAI